MNQDKRMWLFRLGGPPRQQIPVRRTGRWPVPELLLWFPLFFIPAFIFSWAILNPEAQAFDSLLQGRVILALSLAGAYTALALVTWAYFAFRPVHAELSPPPAPAA